MKKTLEELFTEAFDRAVETFGTEEASKLAVDFYKRYFSEKILSQMPKEELVEFEFRATNRKTKKTLIARIMETLYVFEQHPDMLVDIMFENAGREFKTKIKELL